MKSAYITFAIILGFFILSSFDDPPKNDPQIRGKWKAEQTGNGIDSMIFDTGGHAVVYNKKTITKYTYRTDPGTSPKNLALIIMDDKTKKEASKLRGIYELVSPNILKLRFAKEIDSDRPLDFDSKDDGLSTILLDRAK